MTQIIPLEEQNNNASIAAKQDTMRVNVRIHQQ